MGYAVELYLRGDEGQVLRQLFSATQSVLGDIGTTPHISLAVFDDVDVSTLNTIVRTFAAQTRPFSLKMSSIAIFPGTENVVSLAPVVTQMLLKVHASLHSQLTASGLSSHPHYRPENWVPHCTVTVGESLNSSLNTIQTIHRANVLGEYSFDNINVVKYRPVVTLSSFSLGK